MPRLSWATDSALKGSRSSRVGFLPAGQIFGIDPPQQGEELYIYIYIEIRYINFTGHHQQENMIILYITIYKRSIRSIDLGIQTILWDLRTSSIQVIVLPGCWPGLKLTKQTIS